jgi:hypothetical protein
MGSLIVDERRKAQHLSGIFGQPNIRVSSLPARCHLAPVGCAERADEKLTVPNAGSSVNHGYEIALSNFLRGNGLEPDVQNQAHEMILAFGQAQNPSA